jgi:hypothetical protein
MRMIPRIEKTRDYLDYLENHILNVARAYEMICQSCGTMPTFQNPTQVTKLYDDVRNHDMSKLSAPEFTRYREHFYRCPEDEPVNENGFNIAWANHCLKNDHHPERWATEGVTKDNLPKIERRILHMVIDWTAMGYRFGDTAQKYYESEKCQHIFSGPKRAILYEIFNNIAKYEMDQKEKQED